MSKENREQNRTARAAAIRAAQDRKERNRRIGIIVAIVVVLGAIVAGGAWYSSGSKDKTPETTATVAAGEGSVVVGDADAPVKVTIYEDFQCPYCRQLEEQTRDFLRENAEAGKVQVEYRPINLLSDLPYSERAMNAFAAVLTHGTPAEALKLHDLLFENQPYESDSGSMSEDDIAELVTEAGATDDAVTEALQTKDTAFFDAATAAMEAKKIQGTPTVFVNGTELTGSLSELVDGIEKAVANG